MAGVRCVEEIIKNDPTIFEISIFGAEKHVNYNRIMLSTVLQGNTSIKEITINDQSWYEENQIQLFKGEKVIEIDPLNKVLKSDKYREVPYDKLILATGSNPFILPLPGNEKEGVISFRTIEDCQKMIDTSRSFRKATVIGGGVLGLEAARGLLNLGMEVQVVHNGKYLMDRQLDQTAAEMLRLELEQQGMRFLLKKETVEITGSKRVEGLRFRDGTETDTDLVVMAVGVRPNIQLATNSGIETNRGIVVNDYMETNYKDIFAVGECVEHRGTVYGLVKPLYEQGKTLASHICSIESQGYKGSILSTQLKVSGVDVFSVGEINGNEQMKAVTLLDQFEGVYKKVLFQDSKVIGAVMFGNISDGPRLLDIIKKEEVLSDEDRRDLVQLQKEGAHSISEMARSSTVCNCNNVTKGTILEAVLQEGLTTVEDVRKCTKASGSCGSCKPIVAEILSYVNSEDFNESVEPQSLCTCTSLTSDDIVLEIQERGLTSMEQVIEVLDWHDKAGCSICKPALNFYLSMIYPEYETDQEMLYINEKQNAYVQKNGAYAIVPQMYGGKTTGKQLHKIASVVDKYGISNIAITSEQRIQLMDIRKEDLSHIWEELDMPFCSTYGNKVKNVKTCLGENQCQCEKEASLQLAINIEKQVEFLSSPYQLKIGVSACMHNGADSTTKDIGVIGMNRGWEIYVGGSSGRDVREGELMCIADTSEEATEIITGLIQYYRETANYLERTWQWVERVGLIHIREVLFDTVLRDLLLDHLEMDKNKELKKEEAIAEGR